MATPTPPSSPSSPRPLTVADFRAELTAYRARGRWSGDACRRLGLMWSALGEGLQQATHPSMSVVRERVRAGEAVYTEAESEARASMAAVGWRMGELLDGIFAVEDIDFILERLEPYAAVQADGQRGGAEGSTGGDWFGEERWSWARGR